ncbi:alpha/beta fold hydrolase [Actinoplanes sp. CA-030573]|uniref:alpha/beta fold hydrolase n=1 Tax=Actinoplanes sp. CA-030573 TaxID=3239898 RepID=UPI003D8B46C8
MPSVDIVTTGTGPGLVVIPGTTRRARHYASLAAALADAYTVHVIERRGRGRSPAQDDSYGMETEVGDVLDVLAATGARQVFGHSYGGLIALHAAMRADLDRVIAYEPGVSVHGSMPSAWLPEYERRLAAGQDARAMVHFLHAMDFVPGGPVVTALTFVMQRCTAEGRDTRAVLPTVIREQRVTAALDSDATRYTAVTAPVLLLGGGRSPAYLQEVLPLLVETMPNAKVVVTPEFDHNAPDLGAPSAVAGLIRA